MVKKPKPALRRTKATLRPFFDLLDQMDEIVRREDAHWPAKTITEARRRLMRIDRAIRLATVRSAEWE